MKKPPATRPGRIANPSSAQGSELIVAVTGGEPVTDRANRYRATEILQQLDPETERSVCHFCGNTPAAELMAGHVDGNEDNNDPANISPTCRPCNNAIAVTFTRLAIGRRTRQFNPDLMPLRNRGEYINAIANLRFGSKREEVIRAIRRMQKTPHTARNTFAKRP